MISSFKKKIYQLFSKQANYSDIYLYYIVNNLPHFLFWKDSKGVFLGCNKKFAESANLNSPLDIYGKTDFDMPWLEYANLYIADDKEIMETGIAKLNYEENQIQNDDSENTMLVSKVPMFNQDNEIIGILGIYTDITVRKEMEKNLQLAKLRAEIASQLKSEFIDNMEHDIRTPFNGIWTLAQILESKETDVEKKEHLGIIVKSAKQLLDYCNNILSFAKFEYPNNTIISKKFNLYLLIESVILMESASAKIKNLKLLFDYSNEVPKYLIGDENRIKRLLINLLSNAIKFTQEGYVNISVKKAKLVSSRKVIIYLIIEDTGIGIPYNKKNLIYEKFMRNTPSAQGLYKGFGLGLPLVKKIIEELEGEIELESELGKGTIFTCIIPLGVPLLDD
ncbi:MAG: hypothetical protein JWM09_1239 [Francisellaceae bacterium]|nr:hypothetical protein [Francisellaceae bacterium]